jgi:hypothetical protein
MSPLCREITGDGTKIQVDIYTDREALDAVMTVIEQDGIRSFLDGESEDMH